MTRDDSLTIHLRSGGTIRITVAGWLSMSDADFDWVVSIVRQMRAYQAETDRLAAGSNAIVEAGVEEMLRSIHVEGCLLWQFKHEGPCEILAADSGAR